MNKKKIISLVVRYSVYGLVALFFFWAIRNHYFDYIFTESTTFWHLVKQHLQLVLVSSVLALLIAIPGGILVTRKPFRRAEWVV
ncbi:hypothetical protein R0J91_12640, partial [Micrococcus sp. SIMBA_131]